MIFLKNISRELILNKNFKSEKYDIILANINRNVLLNSAVELNERLNAQGILLISGILDEDVDLVSNKYVESGFKIETVLERGYWRCILLCKIRQNPTLVSILHIAYP